MRKRWKRYRLKADPCFIRMLSIFLYFLLINNRSASLISTLSSYTATQSLYITFYANNGIFSQFQSIFCASLSRMSLWTALLQHFSKNPRSFNLFWMFVCKCRDIHVWLKKTSQVTKIRLHNCKKVITYNVVPTFHQAPTCKVCLITFSMGKAENEKKKLFAQLFYQKVDNE